MDVGTLILSVRDNAHDNALKIADRAQHCRAASSLRPHENIKR